MSVFRKQTTKNGTKVYSAKWYGSLRTFDGKRRHVPLAEDKRTAETLLRRLQPPSTPAASAG